MNMRLAYYKIELLKLTGISFQKEGETPEDH